MVLNAKILGLVAVLGGGGIAIPLYLKSSGKSPVSSESKQVKIPAIAEAKTTERAECSVSSLSSELEGFLKKLGKEAPLYSTVSCKNTILTGDNTSLLEKDWMGLFTKNVLESTFSVKEGVKFEMKVETEREEGIRGTRLNIKFSNPQKTTTLSGELGDHKTTDSGRKAVEVTLNGVKGGPKEAYLFVAQ